MAIYKTLKEENAAPGAVGMAATVPAQPAVQAQTPAQPAAGAQGLGGLLGDFVAVATVGKYGWGDNQKKAPAVSSAPNPFGMG